MPISGLSDKDGDKKVTTTTAGAKQPLDVLMHNSSGSVVNGGLVTEAFDSIYATYPDSTSEVYTYKLLGSTVATLTVTFTTSAKTILSSVVKT